MPSRQVCAAQLAVIQGARAGGRAASWAAVAQQLPNVGTQLIVLRHGGTEQTRVEGTAGWNATVGGQTQGRTQPCSRPVDNSPETPRVHLSSAVLPRCCLGPRVFHGGKGGNTTGDAATCAPGRLTVARACLPSCRRPCCGARSDRWQKARVAAIRGPTLRQTLFECIPAWAIDASSLFGWTGMATWFARSVGCGRVRVNSPCHGPRGNLGASMVPVSQTCMS